MFKNFIGGEWVEAAGVTRNVNPSEHARRDRRIRPGRRRTMLARRSPPPPRPQFRAGGAPRRRSASSLTRRLRQRDPGAASDELGRPAGARGRQDPAGGHRRSRARRPDLQVLRRRSAAADRREGRLGASRHRGRDHPRAGRRGRPDHAVELSRSRFRPGRSRRLWPTAIRVVFKPAELVPGTAHALAEIIARAGLPGGRVQPRDGPGSVVGQTLLETSRRRRDHLHRLGRHRPATSRRPASPRRR